MIYGRRFLTESAPEPTDEPKVEESVQESVNLTLLESVLL